MSATMIRYLLALLGHAPSSPPPQGSSSAGMFLYNHVYVFGFLLCEAILPVLKYD